MANKTATLKNQAGDNIYPNIIGDNRNAAIKDSTTIKHTLVENKISLDLDAAIKEKINAALQKPTDLTKTKLVGVGTQGQENIEIGDNLTLANGKLSATGGGSGGNEFDVVVSSDFTTYTGTISGTKPVLFNLLGNICTSNIVYNENKSAIYHLILTEPDSLDITTIKAKNGEISFNQYTYSFKFYHHFITMTDSNKNVALFLTIQNTIETPYIDIDLLSYLTGKKVLANGNLHGVVPTYISGEGGVIKIYYMTPGDSNINSTPDEYQDLSSFTITDLVTPVE